MTHNTTIDPAWQARMDELVDTPTDTLLEQRGRLRLNVARACAAHAPGRQKIWDELALHTEAIGRQQLAAV